MLTTMIVRCPLAATNATSTVAWDSVAGKKYVLTMSGRKGEMGDYLV